MRTKLSDSKLLVCARFVNKIIGFDYILFSVSFHYLIMAMSASAYALLQGKRLKAQFQAKSQLKGKRNFFDF